MPVRIFQALVLAMGLHKVQVAPAHLDEQLLRRQRRRPRAAATVRRQGDMAKAVLPQWVPKGLLVVERVRVAADGEQAARVAAEVVDVLGHQFGPLVGPPLLVVVRIVQDERDDPRSRGLTDDLFPWVCTLHSSPDG